jgi:hypothetical protein
MRKQADYGKDTAVELSGRAGYLLALAECWCRPADRVDYIIRRWTTSHLMDRPVRYALSGSKLAARRDKVAGCLGLAKQWVAAGAQSPSRFVLSATSASLTRSLP